MAKLARRNYERQDFSVLLNDLHANVEVQPIKNEEAMTMEEGLELFSEPEEEKDKPVVSIHRKKRQSKLDSVKMQYAFSVTEKILHDRSCKLVWNIPDEEFQMCTNFTIDMKLCPECQRMSVIRAGLGDDGNKIKAYNWFFNQVKATSKDLYDLIIENQAKIKWIDQKNMQIHVHEDTWIVQYENGEIRLLHNNYSVIDGAQRFFEKGFHRQHLYDRPNFRYISILMINYTWDKHLESVKRKKEREDILKKAESDMLELENYLELDKFSLRYSHFIYLDLQDYLADKIFDEMNLQVIFEKEYESPKNAMRIIFCKIPKKQKDVFIQAMKQLSNNMIKGNHLEYVDVCKHFNELMNSRQVHGR